MLKTAPGLRELPQHNACEFLNSPTSNTTIDPTRRYGENHAQLSQFEPMRNLKADMKTARSTSVAILIVTAIACIPGCKPSEPEIEHRQITGTIKSKREQSPGHWLVRMDFVNKAGTTMPVEGEVTPDTEILINGRVATMEDVRDGEHADVLGRIETTDQGRTITALKIKIARDESVSFGKADTENQ